jgi:hypothetical protein
LLVLTFAAWQCALHEPARVSFVVPNGFRGVLIMIDDSAAPEVPRVDGRYVVRFPPDGVFRARSVHPVLRYVLDRRTWTFENGTELTHDVSSETDRLPPNSLRVFDGGSMTKNDGPSLFYNVVAEAKDVWTIQKTVDDRYDALFPRR